MRMYYANINEDKILVKSLNPFDLLKFIVTVLLIEKKLDYNFSLSSEPINYIDEDYDWLEAVNK